MGEKAKNSEKAIFGKSDSKVPKVGGGQAILEKYHKKAIIFCWMASLSQLVAVISS